MPHNPYDRRPVNSGSNSPGGSGSHKSVSDSLSTGAISGLAFLALLWIMMQASEAFFAVSACSGIIFVVIFICGLSGMLKKK